MPGVFVGLKTKEGLVLPIIGTNEPLAECVLPNPLSLDCAGLKVLNPGISGVRMWSGDRRKLLQENKEK